jgi:hypothetical protein
MQNRDLCHAHQLPRYGKFWKKLSSSSSIENSAAIIVAKNVTTMDEKSIISASVRLCFSSVGFDPVSISRANAWKNILYYKSNRAMLLFLASSFLFFSVFFFSLFSFFFFFLPSLSFCVSSRLAEYVYLCQDMTAGRSWCLFFRSLFSSSPSLPDDWHRLD